MADGPYGRSPLAGVRSVLETPILDDRKWAKVPSIPADAVLLDIEDSVPSDRKREARDAVARLVASPAPELADRVLLPRVNSLETEHGEADLTALARAGAALVAYPKVRTARELAEVRLILRSAGADPWLVPVIETARAVIEIDQIARMPRIAGFLFGPYDLATDVGFTSHYEGQLFADAYCYAKSKLVLAGAAFGIPAFDMVSVPELRDLTLVRTTAGHARRMGFAGMATFYPPHVEVINELFSPSPEEISAARKVVHAYERALAVGAAAGTLDGKHLIVQDYKRALRVLEQAKAVCDGLH